MKPGELTGCSSLVANEWIVAGDSRASRDSSLALRRRGLWSRRGLTTAAARHDSTTRPFHPGIALLCQWKLLSGFYEQPLVEQVHRSVEVSWVYNYVTVRKILETFKPWKYRLYGMSPLALLRAAPQNGTCPRFQGGGQSPGRGGDLWLADGSHFKTVLAKEHTSCERLSDQGWKSVGSLVIAKMVLCKPQADFTGL